MSEIARNYLVGKLGEHLGLHSTNLSRQGQSLLPSLSQVFWDSENRRFYCELKSLSTGSCRVTVSLPFDLGDEPRYECSCFFALQSHGRCRHTWALLEYVFLYLTHEDNAITRSALRMSDTPAWTRTLEVLDGFLEAGPGSRRREDEPARRLTWRVSVSANGFGLGAWEQRISKTHGKWTSGRRVSWEHLLRHPALLTEKSDREAAAAIYDDSYFYYDTRWSIDVFAALRALCAHPLVFLWDEPKKNVTVEEAELGLTVGSQDDGLSLDGSLGSLPLRGFAAHHLFRDPEGRGLLGFVKESSRVLVGTAEDPRVVDLVLKAHKARHVVPAEGREEMLRRLVRLESVVPLTLPSDLVDENRPADPRLYLRLEPEGAEGLEARLLVRPAPEGSYFRPGDGPTRLLGVADPHTGGEPRSRRAEGAPDPRCMLVERRFEKEVAAARECADRLGLGRPAEGSRAAWRWQVEGDKALDLVLAAQQEAEQGLVVEWPEGGRRRVASVAPKALSIRIRDRRDWFGVEGSVEGDGFRLPLFALLQALREGRRYVKVGDGTWAEIARELRERLAALDDVVHVHKKRLEVDVTAAPVVRELAEGALTLEASRRFRQLLDRLDAARELTPDPPAELTAELRDYQLEGYRWLRRLAAWGVGGCLADDMGLGKTVQTLAVLIDRRDEGPALVAAPTSVGFNWVREAERFAPTLDVKLYRETDRDSVLGELGPGDVVVTSYGLVRRDADKLAKVRWGTLVVDEAQAIKNSRTKTAKAVRGLTADWRLALTGTPVENHLGELWSLFRAISPGLFGSWERFAERFAAPIEKNRDPGRREALSRLLRPFVLRRAKSEVLSELPERTEVELTVELGTAERELYEDTRLKALLELSRGSPHGTGKRGGGKDQRFQVLAALTRLRQLACHPALVDPEWVGDSAKLALLVETVEELLDGGHRALVFSQFTQHLGLIRRRFDERGIRYQYLDGQTPARQRAERIDAFQDGGGDVFLISLKAGGTGLNLTAADYVIHMDPWWNPAVEDQATDRAHRIGQTRPVTVYRLVARGTIEEEILSLHADKRDLVAGVLAGTDQAGKLSTEELVGLLRAGGEKPP